MKGFPGYLAACTPQPGVVTPRLFSAPQIFLHFALLISALAKTLRVTLWGGPVARVWSLRAPATLRPYPNVAPRRGYTNPRAVGCEVAVSRGVWQEQGVVAWL